MQADPWVPSFRPSLTDDEIRLFPGNRSDQVSDLGGREEVVGIHEDENLRRLSRRHQIADAGQTGSSVSGSRFTRHGGAAVGRDPSRVVGGAVIDDQHEIDSGVGKPVEKARKTVGLVADRDENGDTGHGPLPHGTPK
jgi:hypothetical protein